MLNVTLWNSLVNSFSSPQFFRSKYLNLIDLQPINWPSNSGISWMIGWRVKSHLIWMNALLANTIKWNHIAFVLIIGTLIRICIEMSNRILGVFVSHVCCLSIWLPSWWRFINDRMNKNRNQIKINTKIHTFVVHYLVENRLDCT